MKTLGLIYNKLDSHRDLAYSLIRMYLGVALVARGWSFLSDPAAITELAGAQEVYWWYSYLIGAHLVGGLMLTFGFLTRLAALLQIPILVVAVFFVHLREGLMTVGQSLELAILVLFLMTVFFIFGSGIIALDNYIAEKKTESQLPSGESGIPA
jgi:uncharacterized membrane protein YphA (DoxX/SURF4 family)